MSGKRKAVGTLIGTAFLLMILVTGIGVYDVIQKLNQSYDETLEAVQELDRLQASELLDIVSTDLDAENRLTLSIRNDGETLMKLKWIGVFDLSKSPVTQRYYPSDVALNPAETETVNSSFTLSPSGSYRIQLVTELGNIYHTSLQGQMASAMSLPATITFTGTPVSSEETPTGYTVQSGNHLSGDQGSLDAVDSDYLRTEADNEPSGPTYAPTGFTFSEPAVVTAGDVESLEDDDGDILVLAGDYMPFPMTYRGWNHRKCLTVDSTYIDADLTGFPVYVELTDPDLAMYAQNDFEDVMFLGDDNVTKLSHEIEEYNAYTGHLKAWVKLDLSATQDTRFWMYYGNPSATDQQDPENTWDPEYRGVWHMNQDPGAASTLLDSTSQNSDGSIMGGMNSGDSVTGAAGPALEFDNYNDYIDHGKMNIEFSSITVEAWIYHQDTGEDHIISRATGTSVNSHYMAMGVDDDVLRVYLNTVGSGGEKGSYDSTGFIEPNEWTYVAYTWSGASDTVTFYGNDQTRGTGSHGGNKIRNSNHLLAIGNINDDDNRFFNGVIDEVRVSEATRSPAWLKATYWTVKAADSFMAVGSDQERNDELVIEFTGSGNTHNWDQLAVTSKSSWTIGSLPVTLQLYDYSEGSYPSSGEGYLSYVSAGTPGLEESKVVLVTGSPEDFRDWSGNWKMRLTAVITEQEGEARVDQVMYTPMVESIYNASSVFTFTGITGTPDTLNVSLVSDHTETGVDAVIQLYDYDAGAWAASGPAYESYTSSGVNEAKWLNITSGTSSYVNEGELKLRFTSTKVTGFTQSLNYMRLYTRLALGELPYDTYRLFTVEVRDTATGAPIPYAQLVIYANGTNIDIKDQSNPVNANANATGQYSFYLKNATPGGESFNLVAVVGTVMEVEELTQLP